MPLIHDDSQATRPIQEGNSWQKDGRTFTEIIQHRYSNCVFAAGGIEGDPVEEVYLRWERDDGSGRMLMLRADELAAIAWVANGALWSYLDAQMEEGDDVQTK